MVERLDIPAEYLTRSLLSKGFEPSKHHSFYIEFTKTYADEQGRVAHAVVQFDRPTPSSPDLKLAGFVVSVQAHVHPSLEAVEERAPEVVKSDLTEIVQVFSSGARRRAVALEQCETCRSLVSEYFRVDDAVVCRPCRASAATATGGEAK